MSAEAQQHYENQRRQQSQAQAQELAADQARGSFDLQDFQSKEFVETAFSPDIERDPEKVPDGKAADLEQLLAAQFGRHLGLSYISEEKADKEEILDMARANLVKMGYARRGGMGSKVTAAEQKIKTGEAEEPTTLTSDMADQIDAAFQERSMLRRLSVDGRGWRGLTTVQTVTKSEGFGGARSSGGGVLNKITGGLFGGG